MNILSAINRAVSAPLPYDPLRPKPLPDNPGYGEPKPRKPSGDPLREALAGKARVPGGSMLQVLRAEHGVTPQIHSEIGRRLNAKSVATARRELLELKKLAEPWVARLALAAERRPEQEYLTWVSTQSTTPTPTPAADCCPRDLTWFHARREQELVTAKMALATLTRQATEIMRPVMKQAGVAARELLDEQIQLDQERAKKFGIPPAGITEPSELHKSIQTAANGFALAAEAPPERPGSNAWRPPAQWSHNLFEL